ncbi:MAG TPA: DUF3413 domain-containing protein [Methylomirabilota bacterium]|nr:DUF3413 domain-containing protein [Methylomirabilota bacterium]
MRRRLLRWANWFALVNAAVLALIGAQYLWQYSAPMSPAAAWTYAVVASAGHMAALAYSPLLVLIPLLLLLPWPRVVLPLGVVLVSALVAFLVLDTLVFAEQRYHLNALTFRILEPTTWGFLALYFLLALAIEAMVAVWVWRRTALPSTSRLGWVLPLVLGICLVSSQLIHAAADPYFYVPVTAFDRYLPLYAPIKSNVLVKLRLVDRSQARERAFVSALGGVSGGTLNYPIAPLRCDPRVPALNVLLVVIDGMRADALNAAAPRLSEFASSAMRFDAHYSGGNTSQTGMFSLFYGIPPTYFDAFYALARPPVLMDMFRQHGYQLGLFSSAPVSRPVVGLDRTAFAQMPNLREETRLAGGESTVSATRDRALTGEWYEWLQRRDPARPFLGFLYYNAAIALDPPDGYPPVVAEAPGGTVQQRRRHGRYLTAVHFVDSLVGAVLEDLARRGLNDKTVVIVTSDHGIEFDEAGLGFKGHGTAFTDYQLRTPLLLRWPGHAPQRVTRRTSHNDLAPTLLTELFGCTNPPSDYASGKSLFSSAEWEWLVAGSRTDHALIQPGRVTIVYASGFEVRDPQYRLIPSPSVSPDALRAAWREMSRFYR